LLNTTPTTPTTPVAASCGHAAEYAYLRNYQNISYTAPVAIQAAAPPKPGRLAADRDGHRPDQRGGSHRDAAFSLHAELCKVLTDPKRLHLIDALRNDERCVSDLAEELGMSLPNASQHLSVLRHAGLVSSRREATTIFYRLSEPRIAEACDIVHAIVADRLGPRGDDRPSRPSYKEAQ